MDNNFLTLFLCLGLSLGGCITQQPVNQNYIRPPMQHIQAAEFNLQTDNLEDDLTQTTDKELQADIHLQLARLYRDFNNPNRDYAKALSHFESFAMLDKKNAARLEIQNWLAVLKFNMAITRLKQECTAELGNMQKKENAAATLQNEIEGLKKKLATSQQQNKKNKAHNQDLQKTIEKLQFLDLKLEKKRKSYR